MQNSKVVSRVAEGEEGSLEATECSIRNEERLEGKFLMFRFRFGPSSHLNGLVLYLLLPTLFHCSPSALKCISYLVF